MTMAILRRLAPLLALTLACTSACGANESDRLVSLARVWASAKFLDPDVAAGTVDWDAALVKAIPKVRAAKSEDDFAAAIDAMLHELHDPASRVVGVGGHASPFARGSNLFSWNVNVFILSAGAYAASHDASEIWSASPALSAQLAKAKGLVIDLRGGPEGQELASELVGRLDRLSPTRLTAPSWRYVFHSGYATQSGHSSGGYYSAFLDVPGDAVAAAPDASVPARIAFVVDASTTIPDAALALREAGRAIIASAAPVDASIAARTLSLTLDEDHAAVIRVGRSSASFQSDLVDRDPLKAATRFASGTMPAPTRPPAPPPSIPATNAFRPELAYAEMTYPDVNHRLLAAFRLWAVIHYFYPYTHLIGDWDQALADSIPHFIAAKDADDYAKAVLTLDARVEDGHSYARGHPSVEKLFGAWVVPFGVRYLEGQYVVAKTYGKDPLVHVGDVIIRVDGEPMADRVKRLWPYFTASTEAARRLRVGATALRGPKGSLADLELRDDKGARRASVPRVEKVDPDGSDDAYKLLDGNIGYVDLSRLTVAQVDPMFDALMKAKAIVFDMRGYPNGTAWSIAPRINTLHAKVGAQFRRRQFSGAATPEESASGFFFEQPLYGTDKPLYQGKTVTLIDERAISQAEHTCLFFESANGTTFVGSPTAGANGDVTFFPLPGGFSVMFTGHDVRHADGRQLQRVGIQPNIAVTPTIAGLRAGRDEVLERAIRFVAEGK